MDIGSIISGVMGVAGGGWGSLAAIVALGIAAFVAYRAYKSYKRKQAARKTKEHETVDFSKIAGQSGKNEDQFSKAKESVDKKLPPTSSPQ